MPLAVSFLPCPRRRSVRYAIIESNTKAVRPLPTWGAFLSQEDLLRWQPKHNWSWSQPPCAGWREPHADWTQEELATCLGRSPDWVKKWLTRFRQAAPTDVSVWFSHSRARHTPPPSLTSEPLLVQQILAIGDAPPENLQRVPGPQAILSSLPRDGLLQAAHVRLPQLPFGRFCGPMGALPSTTVASAERKTSKTQARKCNWISKMP